MTKLKIHNYDTFGHRKKTLQKSNVRNSLCPKSNHHIMIVGGTSSGKTNLLLNMIYDLFHWDTLYVCAKDCQEPKYMTLLSDLEAAQEVDYFDFQITNDLEEFQNIDNLDPQKHNLIVFDDFCGDKKSMQKINEYIIRGRKKNCTVIFLTQSYFDTLKSIRLNCSYFCFFKLNDSREIGEIHKTHNCGLTRKCFYQTFQDATAEPYNFLCIDLTSSKSLRKNFDYFYFK